MQTSVSTKYKTNPKKSSIAKATLWIIFVLAILQTPSFGQSSRKAATQIGIGFNKHVSQPITITRNDFKTATISTGHNGFSLFYSDTLFEAFFYKISIGQQNRFISEKLFSEDSWSTNLAESNITSQVGIGNIYKGFWGLTPFTLINLTYYNIKLKVNSVGLNSSISVIPSNGRVLDTEVSETIIHPSFAFGVDLPFKYAGIKFFAEVFPESFQKGGKLGSNNVYWYKMQYTGFNLGIGFFALL